MDVKTLPLLKFSCLSNFAKPPIQGTPGSIGFDLSAAYNYTIKPNEATSVKTDLIFYIPEGYYGRLAGRSGLAKYNTVILGGGVIDPDYRGNVEVILINLGKENFHVLRNDRIAQLILERAERPHLEMLLYDENRERTSRFKNGFGSTGI